MSLRPRFILTVMALVLASVVTTSLLQAVASRESLRERARTAGHDLAEILARGVAVVEETASACAGRGGGEPAAGERPDLVASLRRLVGNLARGDVREVRILDAELAPLVGRRIDDQGRISDVPTPLGRLDADLARDCLATGRTGGRFDAQAYHVAAPVQRPDGRASAAVVVTVSGGTDPQALWRRAAAATGAVLLVGLPGAIAAAWLARGVTDPVRRALAAAGSIAAGDLALGGTGDETVEMTTDVAAKDLAEPGRLPAAISGLARSIGGLVQRVRSSAARLMEVEAGATAALDRQDRAVRRLNGTAGDVVAAAAGITTASEQLLAATGDATATAREAVTLADEGRDGLQRMAGSMQHLDEAMNTFNGKLATISQRASGINSVVTAIAKVAEQTNLLSVNATIEAEKAGESGRGFRIVAQEIRRLADQTALATKDIERMVRDMQAAVAGGTMEMDRFRNEVSERLAEVSRVSEKLGRIIEPVHSVARSLEEVHDGMAAQSQGARRVRDAAETLRTEAGDASVTVGTFATSLADLRRAVAEFNADAARFRT